LYFNVESTQSRCIKCAKIMFTARHLFMLLSGLKHVLNSSKKSEISGLKSNALSTNANGLYTQEDIYQHKERH